MAKPVIIEFAGVSCCGKSTAFSSIFMEPMPSNVSSAETVLKTYYVSIAKTLFFINITTPSPIFKAFVLVWVHLMNVLRYHKFYGHCIVVILQGSDKLKACNSFFFKVGKCLLLRQINQGVTLIDEGIIQLLFSLFVRYADNINDTENALNKIIEHAPLPDEVIFGPIEPIDMIINRMIKRGHHRVTSDLYTSDELKSRVATFTVDSINLQVELIKHLNGRLTIHTLNDVDHWGKAIERFRHNNDDKQSTPSFSALAG